MKNRATLYKDISVSVEIEVDDVLTFIQSYASEYELSEIRSTLESSLNTYPGAIHGKFEYTGLEGTLIQDQKLELLSIAFKKYSLSELEERLGRAFDIQ